MNNVIHHNSYGLKPIVPCPLDYTCELTDSLSSCLKLFGGNPRATCVKTDTIFQSGYAIDPRPAEGVLGNLWKRGPFWIPDGISSYQGPGNMGMAQIRPLNSTELAKAEIENVSTAGLVALVAGVAALVLGWFCSKKQ